MFEQNKGQAPADVRYLLRTPEHQYDFKRGQIVVHSGSSILRLRFNGRLENLVPGGYGRLDHLVRYVDSNDDEGSQEIAKFASVKYESLYPGIDLKCYGRSQQLECDFVARPGADPEEIRIGAEGADRIEIDDAGALVMQVAGTVLQVRKPNALQVDRGQRKAVDVRYKLTDADEISFVVGEYDRSIPLIISHSGGVEK